MGRDRSVNWLFSRPRQKKTLISSALDNLRNPATRQQGSLGGVPEGFPGQARKSLSSDNLTTLAKNLTDESKDDILRRLMNSDAATPSSKPTSIGRVNVDMDDFDNLERLKELAQRPKGLEDIEYAEAKKILDKYIR